MVAIKLKRFDLNEVFTPGGQPSITYVNRAHLGIERAVEKAIALPNTIVSLTGPTKCGKTVLCKSVLSSKEYVWLDGGQLKDEDALWERVCAELNLALEVTDKEAESNAVGGTVGIEAQVGIPNVAAAKLALTPNGSRLKLRETSKKATLVSMKEAIDTLVSDHVCLVIDDFHYMTVETRTSVIKSLKGAVFRGLKVILLSTPHRAFDAIKAEEEITGRFKHVTVPDWSEADLSQIATEGFSALNVAVDSHVTRAFTRESEGSPLLMQSFCWNACYDAGVKETSMLATQSLQKVDTGRIFDEVSQDAGYPMFEKLAKGPQSRTDRLPRPLKTGGQADIYQAILLAIAMTGPKAQLSYDQIRASLNSVLSDKIPQKLEVSNALIHLTKIDADENRGQRAIDWDADNLNLFITNPFFRFYLRWQVAEKGIRQ